MVLLLLRKTHIQLEKEKNIVAVLFCRIGLYTVRSSEFKTSTYNDIIQNNYSVYICHAFAY